MNSFRKKSYLRRSSFPVRPKVGNVSILFLSPANKVWSKVIFSEACVILFTGWISVWYHFCLAAWSHVPSRGSLSGGSLSRGSLSRGSVSGGVFVWRGSVSGGVFVWRVSVWGFSVQGVSVQGGVSVGRPPPLLWMSRWYASYWNAVLLCSSNLKIS